MHSVKLKKKLVKRVCCVPSCNNTNDINSIDGDYYAGKYVHFPKDAKRCRKWMNSLDVDFTPNAGSFICCAHFPENAWRRQDVIMNVPLTARRLNKDAVPLLIVPKQSCDVEHKEHDFVMDVETRKRLVAEALASYEKEHNNEPDELEQTTIIKPKTKRYAKKKSVSACSVSSIESEITYMDSTDSSYSPQETDKPKACDETANAANVYFELVDEAPIEKEYKKFGELMFDVHDFTYALNCSFCESIYFELMEFKSHVFEQHKNLLHICNDYTNEVAEVNETPTKNESNDVALFEDEQPVEYIETELLFIEETDQQLFIEENNEDKQFTETDIIETVIVLWKKRNILWDKAHPDYNKTKMQNQAFQEMFNELKTLQQFKRYDLDSMKSLLADLTRAYREDLHTYRNLSKYRKKHFKPKYWFFYKLNFLNEKFNFLRNAEDELKIASYLPVDTSTRQKEVALLEIIEIFEDTKSLWHINDTAYEGKLANQTALETLFAKLKEKRLHVYLRSLTELTELLKSLIRWFSAVEYLKQTASFEQKTETSSPAATFSCGYPSIYEALNFLQNHVPPFNCTVCHQTYFSEYIYLKHIRSKKNNCTAVLEGKAHTCEYCQKIFTTVANLRCHVRQHTNERPYECKICGKCFRNYATCYRHKRTHTKIKPHECSYCKRSYHCKNLLNLHIKTHLDIRDHVCDICGKSFTWSRYLNRHRLTHLTEKIHPCPICGNKYKSKDLLNAHHRRCRKRRIKLQEDVAELLSESELTTVKIEPTEYRVQVEQQDDDEVLSENATSTIKITPYDLKRRLNQEEDLEFLSESESDGNKQESVTHMSQVKTIVNASKIDDENSNNTEYSDDQSEFELENEILNSLY